MNTHMHQAPKSHELAKIILDLTWNHNEITIKSSYNHKWIIMKSAWNHHQIIMKSPMKNEMTMETPSNHHAITNDSLT